MTFDKHTHTHTIAGTHNFYFFEKIQLKFVHAIIGILQLVKLYFRIDFIFTSCFILFSRFSHAYYTLDSKSENAALFLSSICSHSQIKNRRRKNCPLKLVYNLRILWDNHTLFFRSTNAFLSFTRFSGRMKKF